MVSIYCSSHPPLHETHTHTHTLPLPISGSLRQPLKPHFGDILPSLSTPSSRKCSPRKLNSHSSPIYPSSASIFFRFQSAFFSGTVSHFAPFFIPNPASISEPLYPSSHSFSLSPCAHVLSHILSPFPQGSQNLHFWLPIPNFHCFPDGSCSQSLEGNGPPRSNSLSPALISPVSGLYFCCDGNIFL